MSSLARQLARLADGAPREVDVDGADTFDDGTQAHKSKRGADGAPSAAVEDADLVLGAPQFRGDIDMGDDERYQGVPTSRKALRRRQRKGAAAADASGSDTSDSDDSADDVAMGMPASDSDEGSDSDDDSDAGAEGGALSSVLASRVPTEDIEAELDALEADDAQMLMRRRADEDKDKAQHTRHQIELWERTLELRIRAQKAMTMAHRMPRADARAAFAQAKPEVGAALKGASASVMTLLDTLGDLHDELVDQSGCLQAPEGGFDDSDSDDAGAGGGADPLEAQWRKMQRRWSTVEPQIVDVVTEWQRKLLFSSGFSAKKQLKVVNQDIRKQTDAVLANRDVLVRRSRLKRTEATREFGNKLTYDFGSAGDGDPDTYDDPDFYQQMLREFIKTSSNAAMAPEARRQSRKRTIKNVDRKASKGRRLRYHAHPKLVNFMAPIPAPEPPLDLDSLHASLFKSRS